MTDEEILIKSFKKYQYSNGSILCYPSTNYKKFIMDAMQKARADERKSIIEDLEYLKGYIQETIKELQTEPNSVSVKKNEVK